MKLKKTAIIIAMIFAVAYYSEAEGVSKGQKITPYTTYYPHRKETVVDDVINWTKEFLGLGEKKPKGSRRLRTKDDNMSRDYGPRLF